LPHREVIVQKSILVVDDNELLLLGLTKALTQEGFEVTTAGSGAEALDRIGARRYDLCLLEMHLPDFKGLDLMRFIRDMQPDISIIFMTADSFQPDSSGAAPGEAAADGAWCLIDKPFSLGEIKKVVKRALDREEAWPPGGQDVGSAMVMNKRKEPRRAYSDTITFLMTLIDGGEAKRISFTAQSVDRSEEGIGLITDFPLQRLQVLSFGEDLEYRSGIVVWSAMLDERTYGAGVKFS
jgi:CheY-like chemotaxis protein